MQKLLWLMPNKKYNKTGVYKYNNELIKILRIKKNINIRYCGLNSNFAITFLYKFFILPFIILIYSKNYNTIIYPEESFAFLRIFSFAKENKIFVHDYRYKFNKSHKANFKEKIKQIFLDFNFLFIEKFDKIFVPSVFTKKSLVNYFKQIKDKISIIPNIINQKKYKLNNSNKKFLYLNKLKKKNKTLVLTVSSNESRKNLKLIYDISKIDKDIIYIIVGKHSSELHENIFTFNNLRNFELSNLFQIADVYFNPSLFEGFGRTSIEAQFYQLPVVCFDTDINLETLGKSGYYIKKSFSPKKIIKKLKNLDYSSKKKITFKNYKKFSPKEILNRYRLNINEI